MLNPDQVQRLRKKVLGGDLRPSLDGLTIRSVLANWEPAEASIEVLHVEPGRRDRMRTPSRIFGTPAVPSCMDGIDDHEITSTDKVVTRVAKAMLVGNQALISNGTLLAPAPVIGPDAAATLKRINGYNHQGFVAERPLGYPSDRLFFVGSPETRRVPGTGLFLHNAEPGNYGSFVFRQLPQLLLLASLPKLDFDFYITPERTPWLRETLVLLGLPERPVYCVGELLGDVVDAVILCNEFDDEGFVDGATRERLQRVVHEVCAGSPATLPDRRRLYVSRRLGAALRPDYRRLLNETAIESAAVTAGFTTIFPETLTVRQQMAAFSQARSVVGPSGSGMLNTVYASPGARVVDMEIYTQTVRQHAKIYASSGAEYAFCFGMPAHGQKGNVRLTDNWVVDDALARQAIDWATQPPEAAA